MNASDSIKLYDEETGKEITIIIPERPKFFKFEVNKTYEVEVDLQRFPIVRKFKNRKGEEYWACVYNLRVLKVDGTPIENPRWVPRRIPVGNADETDTGLQVVPRIGSEFYQLVSILTTYGKGVHKCIVETREGNNGQVLTRFKHSEDCECLKNKSNERSGQEDRGQRAGSVEDSNTEARTETLENLSENATPEGQAKDKENDTETSKNGLEMLERAYKEIQGA